MLMLVSAAHYEFKFEDEAAVSLQPGIAPTQFSEITIGKPYTLTVNTGNRAQSFFGLIRAIEGVQNQSESKGGLCASVTFSIWDEDSDAPFGYLPEWDVRYPSSRFTDFFINLGDTVTLNDEDRRGGTAQITWLGCRDVHLSNLTGALQVCTYIFN